MIAHSPLAPFTQRRESFIGGSHIRNEACDAGLMTRRRLWHSSGASPPSEPDSNKPKHDKQHKFGCDSERRPKVIAHRVSAVVIREKQVREMLTDAVGGG